MLICNMLGQSQPAELAEICQRRAAYTTRWLAINASVKVQTLLSALCFNRQRAYMQNENLEHLIHEDLEIAKHMNDDRDDRLEKAVAKANEKYAKVFSKLAKGPPPVTKEDLLELIKKVFQEGFTGGYLEGYDEPCQETIDYYWNKSVSKATGLDDLIEIINNKNNAK